MKRFITFTVAVLLGLVSSEDVPEKKPDTPVPSPTLQSDFVYKSKQWAMPWDEAVLAANAASC